MFPVDNKKMRNVVNKGDKAWVSRSKKVRMGAWRQSKIRERMKLDGTEDCSGEVGIGLYVIHITYLS